MSRMWTMLSYNLKTILRSYVSEQAYFPCISPVSGWVCRRELKGSSDSLLRVSAYRVLIFGCAFAIFLAFLRYAGACSISRFIKDSLHRIFHRLKADGRFLFGFQDAVYEP